MSLLSCGIEYQYFSRYCIEVRNSSIETSTIAKSWSTTWWGRSFLLSACLLHLAELLSICVRQECFEGLEARVDALHAPTFIAVGDLTADSSLLVLGRLWTEGDVGQAEGVRSKKRDHHYSVHEFNWCNEDVWPSLWHTFCARFLLCTYITRWKFLLQIILTSKWHHRQSKKRRNKKRNLQQSTTNYSSN